MSKTRRNFSAKFKSDIVIELLQGEKSINELASEHSIQPNLIRKWKTEFLEKAPIIFDENREQNIKDKLESERKEKAQYQRKVGQLTMQVDWLKKNLKSFLDLTTKLNLLKSLSKTKELPVSVGAELLDINRTSVYYQGTPVSQEELDSKAIIDRLHTDHPTWGARQMSTQLKVRGYKIGRKKARRFMNEMGIDPIYPKMNLSKRAHNAMIMPYLLKKVKIVRPGQAYSIDITYIKMKHGFLYLTAIIIDWYSRYIVAWELSDTLDTESVIRACEKAFKIRKPENLNSDQGCQFTSQLYKNFLAESGVTQSMDGKGRWADNIVIERWFRSLKYEEIYITEYMNTKEARIGIGNYIQCYNNERLHSSIGYHTPASYFFQNKEISAA